MAYRALQLSPRLGISAAGLLVVLISLALLGVVSKAQWGSGLGPADWAAVRFTVLQALLSALLSVGLAVPVARALARRRFIGREILVTLLGAPFILPVIVAVMGILTVFGRSGWVNDLLSVAGLPNVSIYGFSGVVLAHVFFNLPLATRLLLQGWQAIPAERFRLAAQLNMSPRAIYRALEHPMLVQILPGALALVFVICLTSFAVALTLGGGPRATTLELAIFQAFRFDFDLGRAALLSILQLLLAGGTALLVLRIVPEISAGGGIDRPLRRWDARGGLQRLFDVLAIAAAATFLILPLVAVVLRGLPGLALLPVSVWSAALNSIAVALMSIVVTLALALPMAGWIASKPRGGVEAIALLGLSASPLMIGTGWFVLINPLMDPAMLTLTVTAAVNAMMSLPFAVRALVPGIRETAQRYGALSETLTMTGWPLWRLVILPRLRPQIGFAAGLSGALSMGDLGVIALFADQDRATLPLQMYRLMGAYRMDAAAGTALLLLAISLLIFWVFDKGGRWRVEA